MRPGCPAGQPRTPARIADGACGPSMLGFYEDARPTKRAMSCPSCGPLNFGGSAKKYLTKSSWVIKSVLEKIDTRRHSPEVQPERRRQVRRVRKQGMKNREVAQILCVSERHASITWQSYLREGKKARELGKRGGRHGARRTLSPEPAKELRNLVIDKRPDQFELPFALWTRSAVKDVIRDRYRIEMPAGDSWRRSR